MRSSRSLMIALLVLVASLAGLVVIAAKFGLGSVQLTPIPMVDLSNITPVGFATVDQRNPLDRGKFAYNDYCAHCHGYSGEGEGDNVDPSLPDALGYMPVPRHDSKGHTWMHPDQIIIASIRQGLPGPLYRYQMPAVPPENLSDAQITDILLYIKQWWTPAQRDAQASMTNQLAQALKRLGPSPTPLTK
jgi:mono/diheme cytochrome c family protein